MKKHFLFLASLVLGFGQLFADEVTFSVSDLKASLPASNTNIAVPYAWKTSPYHVTATIEKTDGTTGTLGVSQVIPLNANYKVTVSVAGAGTLNSIKFTTTPPSQNANATASTGTFASGTWTPDGSTNSVTFTCTGTFRLQTIAVDYTPDAGYNPDVPVGGNPLVGPFEATPIESLASYTGTEPYVFDMAARKYYAYNNLNQYEEFGLYPEVNTLKVADNTGAKEIEYLKSPNGAYINLNYIPKANSKAICTMVAQTGGDWKAAYGCGYYSGGWKDRFCFFTTNATINLGGETGNRDAMRYDEKIVTVLDAVAGKMDIFEADGTTLIGTITDSPKTADCKTPLYVFAQNKDVPGGGKQTDCYNPFVTIYSLQLYEGETLVMDLVPAVDALGKGGLKDKLTGMFYGSANSAEFELSADGQAIAADAGITVYPGKLVINTTDQHEYNWNGTEWVDLGSVYKPIMDTDYQNMNNWTCRWGYAETYGHIENDGNNNFFNPYNGKGDWEPYQCKIVGLTKGETYRVSFKFTSAGWNSWSSYTMLPFFVTNNWDFGRSYVPSGVGGEVLGYIGLPQAAMTSQPYSFTFTADAAEATMAIQFGVGDDNKDFYFHFDDLKIEFVDYPQKYAISWTDPNKYEPLAYIESTGAARENVFTTPYYAKASTEVDVKFQSYSGGNWRAIFSGRNGSDASNGISLYQNGDQAHFGYFVGGYRNDNHADYPGHNQDITVAASLGNLNVNGTDYPTNQTTFNASSRKISLFANPEWDNAFRGRIYYFTIMEGDETVYDFQPVMRHDGAFGYYDAATATFLQPVQGNWNGYGFATLEDQSYIYFTTEPRTMFVGFTEKFEPTVQNIEPAFTWTSSDESVATVAADGTVTGVAKGTVTITATDTNSDWIASYVLDVEPAVVAADQVEVWDGTSDAIVGSIRWGGDSYKPAYTITFDSGEGFGDWSTSNPKYNVICGVPEVDENNKAWYEAGYQMTNVPGSIWSYNNTVLPNNWPSNPGEVYVRRYFKAEGELPEQLYMPAPHDDAPCEYYINGTMVWSRTGLEPGVNGWYEGEVVKLSDEQIALIKTDGSVNVFAYHVHQNWGGRYADGGIYGNSMADNSPSKAFEGNENRKRAINAAEQAIGIDGFPADLLEYILSTNFGSCIQDGELLGRIRWELRKALSPRHDFDFASAEPADGLECWLYNVGAGQILAGGNSWGTHASLDYNISSWPMILRANSSGENRYAIQTNLPNGRRGANDGLGHNGYVDCGYGEDFTTSEGWAWTFEAVGDGTYRIINSQNSGNNIYLGMTQDERYQVDTDKAGADNPYNLWKVITREQLEALAADATPENPADVSYFIHQNTFSANDFDGNDKDAANAELSDSKWERNAGSIWGWNTAGESDRSDYIFEMWNTKDDGKVWLVQEIEGLPAGQYYVECTGYYRDGNWDDAIAGNMLQLAYLFAGTEENCTPLPSILDGANLGAGYGRLSETLIPDGAVDAARFFRLGAYDVQSPVVTVGADGKLTIGIYRDGGDEVKEQDWITADNFRLYCVGFNSAQVPVTVGEDLYATFVAPANVDFTGAEVSAFAAQTAATYVHLEPVTSVPAGTAVVVKADAAGTYNVNSTFGAALGTENDLVAATADVVADGTQYILAKQGEVVGFSKATPETTIAAGKGYLVITGAAGVKAFYPFEDGDATGIEMVNGQSSMVNAPIYNIAGQRIGKMQKGVNITNGKKVLK